MSLVGTNSLQNSPITFLYIAIVCSVKYAYKQTNFWSTCCDGCGINSLFFWDNNNNKDDKNDNRKEGKKDSWYLKKKKKNTQKSLKHIMHVSNAWSVVKKMEPIVYSFMIGWQNTHTDRYIGWVNGISAKSMASDSDHFYKNLLLRCYLTRRKTI